MLVLVADAEQEYAEVIGELLRRRMHRVVLAASAESLRHFLTRSSAELIIVSSSIIGGEPAALVEELRRQQAAPVVVLFDGESPMEIAACFDAGADDCVRKPFHPSEFAARISAVVRRATVARAVQGREFEAGAGLGDQAFHFTGRGLEFDEARNSVFYHGVDLNCSQTEYQILRALGALDGQPLSHASLNQRVWGYPNLTSGTLLKGHVSSIRRKIRAAGFDHDLIRTIYGVGYALSLNNSVDEVFRHELTNARQSDANGVPITRRVDRALLSA